MSEARHFVPRAALGVASSGGDAPAGRCSLGRGNLAQQLLQESSLFKASRTQSLGDLKSAPMTSERTTGTV